MSTRAARSGPTTEPGWGTDRVTRAWLTLMDRLGYERFGAQGGDTGAIVSPKLGRLAPDRLIGIAAIPMQDARAAVRELQRAASELDMRGAFIRPNPCNGRALHDPHFDLFWAAAAEAGLPVALHPSGAGDLPGALQGLRLDAPIMGHPSIFFIDDYVGFSHLVCGVGTGFVLR